MCLLYASYMPRPKHESNINQPYLNHISTISQPYLNHGPTMEQMWRNSTMTFGTYKPNFVKSNPDKPLSVFPGKDPAVPYSVL